MPILRPGAVRDDAGSGRPTSPQAAPRRYPTLLGGVCRRNPYVRPAPRRAAWALRAIADTLLLFVVAGVRGAQLKALVAPAALVVAGALAAAELEGPLRYGVIAALAIASVVWGLFNMPDVLRSRLGAGAYVAAAPALGPGRTRVSGLPNEGEWPAEGIENPGRCPVCGKRAARRSSTGSRHHLLHGARRMDLAGAARAAPRPLYRPAADRAETIGLRLSPRSY